MSQKRTMICMGHTVHDPNATPKLYMIQFRIEEEMSTLHLYRDKAGRDLFEAGERYPLEIGDLIPAAKE